MITKTRFASPSFYVGQPTVTIFNGAQSWSDPVTRARVAMRGLPALIELFGRSGLSFNRLIEARQFAGRLAYEATVALCTLDDPGTSTRPLSLLGAHGIIHYPYLLRDIWRGYVDSKVTSVARGIARIERLMGRT
jgi:hypothetical protein